jgi:hypothetical protein
MALRVKHFSEYTLWYRERNGVLPSHSENIKLLLPLRGKQLVTKDLME